MGDGCEDHRPPRHGRLLCVGGAAPSPWAERQASRRLRLGAAGCGDDGQLRGAAAGRDPLRDAGGDRPPQAPGRGLHQAGLRCLPGGLGAGDGGPPPQRRDGRGRRPRRGLSRPDRPVCAEGDDAPDRRRDPRGDRVDLLDRHLREPAARQDHQRAGQARRAGRPLPSRGARALRGRPAGARPRNRAEDRGEAGADGHRRPGLTQIPRPRRARERIRAADGRLAPGPGPIRGRDPDRRLASDQVASQPRPPSMSTSTTRSVSRSRSWDWRRSSAGG